MAAAAAMVAPAALKQMKGHEDTEAAAVSVYHLLPGAFAKMKPMQRR